MPTYEYLCQDCSYRFELKQSINDDPVATCAQCGKSVSRIISAPAIMFKGSGWYVTDYSEKMKPPTGESPGPTADPKKETTADAGTTPAAPAAANSATASTPSGSTPSSGSSPSSS
ncbi:MAG: FmdB family zinc ribbon protein [Nitrospiraceae bacterium]